MATLLENLNIALEENRHHLEFMREKGISSLHTLYPNMNYDSEQYYQLLAKLPYLIENLERRIRELNNKVKD